MGGQNVSRAKRHFSSVALPQIRMVRFACGYATAFGREEVLFFTYPALIPHPASPGLGNVPGYYRSSRQRRDWTAEVESLLIARKKSGIAAGLFETERKIRLHHAKFPEPPEWP